MRPPGTLWGAGGLEGDMDLEPRRADRSVAASESAGFAADGLPSPHPRNQPPQKSSITSAAPEWGTLLVIAAGCSS
jgi:hypothetical protein